MAKRRGALGSRRATKHSPKTKKRLAIKHARLAAQKKRR
jgi:hypothetical protein